MPSTPRIRLSLALASALACSGCPIKIAPPTAVISTGPSSSADDAGACDEVTKIASRVGVAPALHASCSTDPNDHALSYHWSIVDQPSGASPSIRNDAVVSPTVLTDAPGSYRLSLIVSNGKLTSEPAYVTLEVDACGARAPEVRAIARAPQGRVSVGALVVLTPTVEDADEEEACAAQAPDDLSFKWSFVRLPPGSNARFNAATAEAPSFVPDVAGEYAARLDVSDASGRSGARTVSFDVTP